MKVTQSAAHQFPADYPPLGMGAGLRAGIEGKNARHLLMG